MSIKSSLAEGFQKCLGLHVDFTDFTVVVEDTSFQCHKFILNACSEYFQGLFRSQMTECQLDRVELKGITKETFSVIHRSIYNGIDGLTEDNILDVWASTVRLQITYLIQECESYIMDILRKENCFMFRYYADLFTSNDVSSAIFVFINKHFETIKNRANFLEITADDVYEIVKSENLKVNSEDSVVEVIIKWMEYNPQESRRKSRERKTNRRHKYFVKFLSAVRLCLVSRECLRNLSKHELALTCREAHDMIFDAMDYNVRGHYHHNSWHKAAIYRTISPQKHVMVYLDGCIIKVYVLNTGDIYDYARVTASNLNNIIVFDNVLYLNNTSCLKMYTQNKVWTNIISTSFTMPAQKNILLSHGDYIYCCSASVRSIHLDRCNCSHGHAQKWETYITRLSAPSSLISFKEYVLLFYSLIKEVKTVCLDTANKVISVNPQTILHGSSHNMVSFVDQDQVFILQTNGDLWKIISTDSSVVDFEKVAKLWNCDWKVYGCVVYMDQLFVFGSKVFNDMPESQDWSFKYNMSFNAVRIVGIKSDSHCLPMITTLVS